MKKQINDDVYLIEDFLSLNQADELLEYLLPKNAFIKWEQQHMTFVDKVVPLPRLTAWYGEKGYFYSGILNTPEPMPEKLINVREVIETAISHSFNSVLLNYYKDGNNHINWHADKETELGLYPIIASYSVGQERVFQLKPRYVTARRKPADTQSIPLKHNSLLVMTGKTQQNWIHRVLKDESLTQPRINLTFRKVV